MELKTQMKRNAWARKKGGQTEGKVKGKEKTVEKKGQQEMVVERGGIILG